MVKGSAFDGEGGGSRSFAEFEELAARRVLARQLVEYMDARGMNQSDLGKAAGLSRNQISLYSRALASPERPSVIKLAKAMRMDPADLWPLMKQPHEAPPASMAMSPDGKQMRLTIDRWVPAQIGTQIIQLLTDNAPSDRE